MAGLLFYGSENIRELGFKRACYFQPRFRKEHPCIIGVIGIISDFPVAVIHCFILIFADG